MTYKDTGHFNLWNAWNKRHEFFHHTWLSRWHICMIVAVIYRSCRSREVWYKGIAKMQCSVCELNEKQWKHCCHVQNGCKATACPVLLGGHISDVRSWCTLVRHQSSGSQTFSGHCSLGSINSSPVVPLPYPIKGILQNSSLHKPLRMIITIK
jgi:hypothetical protein